MANFEALIRNAFTKQDASSPQVREAIYQSSRNALQRILDANRSITVEGAMDQRTKLEEAIARIEAEITAPPPPPPPPEPAEVKADKIFVDEGDPLYEIQQILTGGKRPPEQAQQIVDEPISEPIAEPVEPIVQAPAPQAEPVQAETYDAPVSADAHMNVEPETVDPFFDQSIQRSHSIHDDDGVAAPSLDEYQSHGTMPAEFKQRRQKQKTGIWLFLITIILILLGWIGYQVFVGLQSGSLLGLGRSGENGNSNAISNQVDAANYITIIKPSDLSSLVVDGRGVAELVTEQNTQMIRLKSMRDGENLEVAAEPLLIRLKQGVLEQIEGSKVQVEIFAKSGSEDQSQFSISCEFANGTECGRKRFVAGVQPQASVFEFDFGTVPDKAADYFLTLSTDTTTNAAVSGEGHVLDVVYIRLKTSDN